MKKIFILFVPFLILLMTIRGIAGNPDKITLNDPKWTRGPFEDVQRARFALTLSYIEDKSFEFDIPIARFATPDLGYFNGKYVSLFAPGVSFLTMPGYLLGKHFGISQIGTFAVISLFASLNFLLVYLIATKLGAKSKYSLFASVVFLFATPAFTYAITLYQHHISVFFILSAIYVYINFKGLFSTWVLWFLIAASISVDFPNFFMMMPIAIATLSRSIHLNDRIESLEIKLKPLYLIAILGAVIPALFFLWFNFESYGNPFQLSGTVATVKSIDSQGLPYKDFQVEGNDLAGFRSEDLPPDTGALGFFNTRNISKGLYVHLLSPDRGLIYFAPLVILSFIGFAVLYRYKSRVFSLLISVAGVNLILYSMWGDPWGGWGFGSRYLIPFTLYARYFLPLQWIKSYKINFLK